MQKPKIQLYVKRSFSEKLSATLDYLSENGKILFKFISYLLLPLCMVQALGINTFMEYTFKEAVGDEVYSDHERLFTMIAGYAVFMIAICIGSMLCSAVVYGLMRLYNERPERLAGVTIGSFRPLLMKELKRSFILGIMLILASGLVIAVIPLMGFIFGTGGIISVLFLIYIVLVVCMIPLSLSYPIYLIEDISVFSAISKAFRLGFKTWGGIFAVVFVIGIIAYIIMGVSSMPWYIMLIARSVFLVSDVSDGAGFVASPAYSFIMYLFAVLQSFFMYVGYVFVYTGLGIQYGHAAEKIDGVSVEHDVDNFENLSDNNDDDRHLFERKEDDIDNFEKL